MVDKLEHRIKELESRLNMNSSNSSKPPSTDDKLKTNKKTTPLNPKRNEGHRVSIKVKI